MFNNSIRIINNIVNILPVQAEQLEPMKLLYNKSFFLNSEIKQLQFWLTISKFNQKELKSSFYRKCILAFLINWF